MNRGSGFVAVHPCCNAAELCEVKKLIGVIALTSKAVFHLASQSSTGFVSGAVSMNRGSGFVAVHPCCNAAELCEVKKLIGVTTLTARLFFILLHRAALVLWCSEHEQGLRLCCCASLL